LIAIDLMNPPNGRVTIGRRGENEYEQIQFIVDEWSADYPNGSVSILYWRPDGKEIILASGCKTSPVMWNPSFTDTAVAGSGLVEVRLMDGDVLGKSMPIGVLIWQTPELTGDGPDGETPDWATTTIESVENAKDEINSMKSEIEYIVDSNEMLTVLDVVELWNKA